MRISVVTAALEGAEGLRATFGSLLEQRWRDWEYVVVDGGSGDGTIGMLQQWQEAYPGRVRWVSEPDGGIYDAMNKGIAMAGGDVLGFLGCGDTFADAWALERIAGALESDGVDAAFGSLVFVDAAGSDRVVRTWRATPYRRGIFDSGWQPAHPTFYARRGCFERYGVFDTALEVSADFDLMFRFMEVHGIRTVCIPHVLVRMVSGGTSNGNLRNILTAHRNIRVAFRKYGRRAPLFYSLRRLMPKLLNRVATGLGVKC